MNRQKLPMPKNRPEDEAVVALFEALIESIETCTAAHDRGDNPDIVDHVCSCGFCVDAEGMVFTLKLFLSCLESSLYHFDRPAVTVTPAPPPVTDPAPEPAVVAEPATNPFARAWHRDG